MTRKLLVLAFILTIGACSTEKKQIETTIAKYVQTTEGVELDLDFKLIETIHNVSYNPKDSVLFYQANLDVFTDSVMIASKKKLDIYKELKEIAPFEVLDTWHAAKSKDYKDVGYYTKSHMFINNLNKYNFFLKLSQQAQVHEYITTYQVKVPLLNTTAKQTNIFVLNSDNTEVITMR